jgi:hypothetical protein
MKQNYFDYFANAVFPSEQLFDLCLYNTIYDNEGYEVLIPSNTDYRFSQIINTDFSDIVNKICRKVQTSNNPENTKELIRTNTRKLEKVREWKSLLSERIDQMETILFFYPVPSHNDIWAHQHYTNFEANLSRCKEGFARLVNAYNLSIAVRSALGLDRPASAVERVEVGGSAKDQVKKNPKGTKPSKRQKQFFDIVIANLKSDVNKSSAIESAAKNCKYSIRHAWNLIQQIEQGTLIYTSLTEILDEK